MASGVGRSVAKYFDENHIRQILQTLNIIDVIGSYVALKPKGKEMVGLCPFHNDSRPSLSVSATKQIFKCFACGAGGDVIKFMMLRERLTFPEAVTLLAERAGLELPDRHSTAAPSADRQQLEKLNRWVCNFFRTQYQDKQVGAVARDYVSARGLSDETARQFELGWAPPGWENLRTAATKAGVKTSDLLQLGLLVEKEQGGCYDRFRERLIFPVRDALGRMIGFGGRTLADDPAKYLNSPENVLFDKSRALYGLHAARDAIVESRRAVVVEGYTDCLMAHQGGLSNVVATLGTALTAEHARMLSRYTERIVVVFDSDEAGQKAAERAIEVFFAQQIQVQLATLPKGNDPCDYLQQHGAEAFSAIVEQAVDALEYKWQGTLTRVDQADTVNGRAHAVEEFLLLVAQALGQGNIDSIKEGFLINRVAKLVEKPVSQVHGRVGQLRRRATRTSGLSSAANRSAPTEVHVGDSRRRAQQEVLEVLLNRPDLFEPVGQAIAEPEQEFTDEIYRPIAQRIWSYCDANDGQGSLVEILATCESTELCRIMTDMAERGAQRGNYEGTLAGALENLRRLKADKTRQEMCQVVSAAAKKYGDDAEAAMLLDIQAKWRPDMRRTGAR